MTEFVFDQYFNWESCPVCGGLSGPIIYPIDIQYLAGHSGLDVSTDQIGVAACQTCAHQFIQPSPSPQFLTLFYASYMSAAKNGFYEARHAREIPVSFREYYSPWLKKIQSVLKRPTPTLLDIGCGLGMFLRLARESGFEVRGIEPNAEAVERLASEYSIEAHNTLLEDYSGDETFDVVTMWDLLEHLARPNAAIEKVHSILNPGGLIVLEVPVRDSLLHWAAKTLYRLSFGRIRRPLFLTYGVHHLQYFTAKSMSALLNEHGFDVLDNRRDETNLEAVRRKSGGFKSRLYNSSLNVLFWLARFLGKQNKLVVIARKRTA